MAKPHLYLHAGRWFCRLDSPGYRRVLGPGRSSPVGAYNALCACPAAPTLPPARVRNRDATIA